MIATVATALLGAVTHVESPNAAEAAPATLAAIAPATDVRKAVPIGPAGQVYEPDGKGAWVRRRAGGTAAVIIGATAIGTTVIAGAKSAPPFKLKGGTWTAVFLTPKAKAIVGTGSRVLTAVGKQVFALDTTAAQPTRLPDAPSRISAVAAGRSRAVAVTDKGLVELVGKAGTWKPIKKAPKAVRTLVSERWALVDKGALDLKTLKTIALPAGVRVDDATTLGETLLVVVTRGKHRELLTLAGSAGAKIERETIPLDASAPIVGVVADDAKRVVVAVRDGKLAMRVAGTWSVVEVRDELPADKPPGPAPALSPGQK
jgi:hypothetical protein